MTDYQGLFRRLAREIIQHEGKIDGDAKSFTENLAAKLQDAGYEITIDVEQGLSDYLAAMQDAIKTGIEKAVEVAISVPGLPQSETIATLSEQAFNERWPDGLKLSDRLWNFSETARTGLEKVLMDAERTGASTGKTIYDMQRKIERGNRFKMVSQYGAKWARDLRYAAKELIKNPDSRSVWNETVAEVEDYISKLAKTGTRNASQRLLDQIKTAVEKGKDELVDKAVKWWLYDKQLYGIKRIARTEMAQSMHRAVIAGTEDDDTIIGYQWRLSASHPVTDICDYYASVEMGLGKGVFTKDAVPRHKAHPHCMCLLIPRVTEIKQKGDKNYAKWLQNLSAEKRAEVMPDWVNRFNRLGMPLERLIRPDGLGLVTRDQLKNRMGEDRFNAADAMGKALADRKWPINKIKPNNRMIRQTLDVLKANAETREVARFLDKLERDQYSVSSREWHYFKYKYQYGESLTSPADLDAGFDKVLNDPNARISKTGERYIVYSSNANRWAIIQPNGHRITVYRPTQEELDAQGNPLWLIHTLID